MGEVTVGGYDKSAIGVRSFVGGFQFWKLSLYGSTLGACQAVMLHLQVRTPDSTALLQLADPYAFGSFTQSINCTKPQSQCSAYLDAGVLSSCKGWVLHCIHPVYILASRCDKTM